MWVYAREETIQKLKTVCHAYGYRWDEYEEDSDHYYACMIKLMIDEAYANMWKDVDKERYNEYKD